MQKSFLTYLALMNASFSALELWGVGTLAKQEEEEGEGEEAVEVAEILVAELAEASVAVGGAVLLAWVDEDDEDEDEDEDEGVIVNSAS